MIDKTTFIEALDGTEAKIKEAFVAGYKAGVDDGESDVSEDHENEYKWWKESREEQKEKECNKWKNNS